MLNRYAGALVACLIACPALGQTIIIDSYRYVAAGSTEDQAPDNVVCSDINANLSNDCTAVDDDPDSPDANWMEASGDDQTVILRASFPTPSGSPTGTQTFRLWVRTSKTTGTGTPTPTMGVWETGDGAADATDASPTSVSSTTGEMKTFEWDASVLETSDGSAVEIYISCPSAGGGPNERTCDFGAIEWVVNY